MIQSSLNFAKIVAEEAQDIGNIMFAFGFSGLMFLDRLGQSFDFIESHQAAIAFIVFIFMGVIKKIYDIKIARDKYIKQKNSEK